MTPAPAVAATLDVSPTQLTWVLLAAMGLLAVVVAALTIHARRGGTAAQDREATTVDDDRTTLTPAMQFVGASFERADEPATTDTGAPPADFKETLPAAIRTRRPATSGTPTVAHLRPSIELPEQPPSVPAATEGFATALGGRRSRDEPAVDDATRVSVGKAGDESAGEETPDLPLAPETGDTSEGDRTTHVQYLALGHVDLSIDVLRRHLVAQSRPMPAVWVMLLDLCRTHGREDAFREIAAEFHGRFNVCAPAWDEYPPDRSQPGLEAYPRIMKELTLTWGTHECRRLLDRLLYDNRSGGRRGFTINAYNDLIALRRAADAVLETIEQDFAEESKVREAYAQIIPSFGAAIEAPEAFGHASPLVRDLESQLDADLRHGHESKSALEREHPAFAEVLVREWGNAGLAARLCEMLSRSSEGGERLSGEAAEDLELLRAMARRLADVNRLPLAVE